MLLEDKAFFHTGVLVIDLIAALLIVGFVIHALVKLLLGAGVTQARLIVAEGAVLGLSMKVAASLLKTLELHSWDQILMFSAIFGLRTLLKQLFIWEKQRLTPGMTS